MKRSGLIEHKKIHDEDRSEFQCNHCNKIFNRKDSLKGHEKLHLKETPKLEDLQKNIVECQMCPKKSQNIRWQSI